MAAISKAPNKITEDYIAGHRIAAEIVDKQRLEIERLLTERVHMINMMNTLNGRIAVLEALLADKNAQHA